MNIPANRKYSETHEWYEVDGAVVTYGLTQYAADELTDITYVELPEVGAAIEAGGTIGEVESVKATSEPLSSIGGTVQAVNDALAEKPELLNEDAFGAGWMRKIETSDPTPLDTLMDAQAYQSMIA